MAMVKTQRAGGSRRPTASPSTQWADVIVASRPPGRQHRGGGADMAEVGVVPAAVDAGRCREGRVHQHDGRADVAQPVGDGLGVEGGHERLREEPGQKPRPRLRIFVEMEIARDARSPSAHSAITASMPVPAEGSSTTSPGRIAAACSAA